MTWIVFLSMAGLCAQSLLFHHRLLKKENDRLIAELENNKVRKNELEKIQMEIWGIKENLDEIERHLKYFAD